MAPDSATQIRWGTGAALIAVALVAIVALVPDPFFRQRVVATMLDDVEGVSPGVQVYFRGAPIGSVRAIALDGPSRTFAVTMGVDRAWRPSPCSFATVASANPLTAPRIELVALETAGAQCAAARRAYGCDPVPGAADLTGCRRPADLFETAALAIGEAAAVARTANAMAQRLAAMLQGDGSAVDMAQVARNATQTLAALNSLSTQLDRSFTPGKGDIALTLSHVRQATGRASEIDVAALNGILRETQALVAQNQANIAGLLTESRSSAGEVRGILEGASASLIATSANLERTSASLGTLSDRLAGDPTYAIRGQRYADPPPPGGQK
ncbi:MlaD family protein [Sphingobium sp. HBC34]|uniref:MlaD family protein n=1 Tax=Sphingobium cyanobacteriorum TaxID=3063954 RepID=A0ABT8ZPU1_9SPHN|nr:MlaD family protein [Sphingobium sp. HBC34]MDO7836554.1 MlaD family protein [Sphingobium sp. HBC34]